MDEKKPPAQLPLYVDPDRTEITGSTTMIAVHGTGIYVCLARG